MNKSKELNFILIAYTFPPTPGIGGRRWAKYVKYLTKKNINFHVIYSTSSLVNGNFWIKDVLNNLKISRYPIHFKYNNYFANKNPNLFEKVIHKVLSYILKFTKYNIFDNSSFSRKIILEKSKIIIDKFPIDGVIITGPPQNIYHFGIDIKRKFGIKLILDYRDLWNGHPTYDLYQTKSEKQRDYALLQEKDSLEIADLVFTVDNSIKQNLIKLNSFNDTSKFHCIPNGFDKDDISLSRSKLKNGKKKIFFAGNIAKDSVELVKVFVLNFYNLKFEMPIIYDQLELVLYFNTNDSSLISYFERYSSENFSWYNYFLDKSEYYKTLNIIDFGLIFLTETYKNSFVTKFSDYISHKNFILHVGVKGGFSDFIISNGIGINFSNQETSNFFITLLSIDSQNRFSNFDNSNFDIELNSNRIINIFNEIF